MIEIAVLNKNKSDLAFYFFFQPYTLPSIPGQHEDLKCLTPETVMSL